MTATTLLRPTTQVRRVSAADRMLGEHYDRGIPAGKLINVSAGKLSTYQPNHVGSDIISQRCEVGRDEERTITKFFARQTGVRLDSGAPVTPLPLPFHRLQDVSFSTFHRQHLMSGVQTIRVWDPVRGGWILNYRMAHALSRNLVTWRRLAFGPWGQKGTKQVELADDMRALCFRPQGGEAGAGTIGFAKVRVRTAAQLAAYLTQPESTGYRLMKGLTLPHGWAGPGQLEPLTDGSIFMTFHHGRWDPHPSKFALSGRERPREYFGARTMFDPDSLEFWDHEVTVTRRSFDHCLDRHIAKREDLVKVVYPMSNLPWGDGTAEHLFGIGDCLAGVVYLPDWCAGKYANQVNNYSLAA